MRRDQTSHICYSRLARGGLVPVPSQQLFHQGWAACRRYQGQPPLPSVTGRAEELESEVRVVARTAIDATFIHETWATAQQADTCIWASCPPPKIWSNQLLQLRSCITSIS